MKILGVTFSNNDSYGKNWDNKDKEIQEELEKWENKTGGYKTTISQRPDTNENEQDTC